MNKRKKTNNQQVEFKINKEIKAPEIRVIDLDNKQVGVMTVDEGIKLAQKRGLDLIEIAPRANPPVAKIADYGKLRYKAEKKLKRERKKSKAGELKEIRLSPFIADQDYKTRVARINEFLREGNKVKVVVVFMGRQMNSKPFGYKLLTRVTEDLESKISVDMEPKFLGRHLAMIISPVKKVKKINENGKTKN